MDSLQIQEDSIGQVDLINFSNCEVEPVTQKEMPNGIENPSVQKFSVNSSDDPFEFHLQKAIMKNRPGKFKSFGQSSVNSFNENLLDITHIKEEKFPLSEKKRPTPRFSEWATSLDNQVSFDLLDDSIVFEKSVMINHSLLKRRSLSVDNLPFSLNEKEPVFSSEIIKQEAKKIAELLKKSQIFNSKWEEPAEMFIDQVSTGLQLSASSEDEIGLPEVLILSSKKCSNLDITNNTEYLKYKEFINSRIDSSLIDFQEPETIMDKPKENSIDGNKNCGEKITKPCISEVKKKTLKINNDKQQLRYQKDIDEVEAKPLNIVKKRESKGPEKKGPLKVFAPQNSQILKNINAARKPLKRSSAVNVQFTLPIATSTPEQKKVSYSKKPIAKQSLNTKNYLGKVVKIPAVFDHPSNTAKRSPEPKKVHKRT